jgi:hypothetical protein
MKWFEKYVVKLLLSRSGPFIQKAITGAAAAALTYAANKLGFDLTVFGVTQEVVVAVIWGIIDVAVTKLPADIIREYGANLQKLLNTYSTGSQLKVDGFVGPVTVAQATTELNR